MKENEDGTADPRFSRVSKLSERLRDAAARDRIDLRAANTLAYLNGQEQRQVAAWLARNPKRRIGPILARKLVKAKAGGRILDSAAIDDILTSKDGRSTRNWVAVPLSDLPEGLTYAQAREWVAKAVEAYRSHGN